MADKAKQDLIENFVKITGVNNDRARFYLESAAWNLELAMGSFYEGDPDDDDDLSAGIVGSSLEQQQPPPSQPETESKKPKSSSTGASSSRFATIGSMQQGDDSDSSEEEGQAFYAGGSERSGQQVLGPKKKKTNVVDSLFKSAREHGAEEVGNDEPQRQKKPVFKGSGYRLGDGEGQMSEKIAGEPVGQTRKQVDCVLKLWKNGFSVDDGPLRDFKDPANQEFLSSISKGEVPHELIREARGGEVNLNMEDHRMEDYVKPKLPTRAFTGEGHTLGSPVPTVISSTPSASSSSSASKSNVASSLKLDESQPTTTIQIRLADGSRLVQKFNHSHTVGSIRQHIISLNPQYASTSFVLQTTFPNRELTDDSETIDKAKLQNAVVVQRIK
ncbi:NSFL1 cofactor p47 [Mactra antiquata]